ncbi:MAG: beta-galactosidase [Patescibacteria group bacterium]
MKRHLFNMSYLLLGLLGTILLAIVAFLFIGGPPPTGMQTTYGMTFSRPYAQKDLGLDPDDVLTAALDDLHIRRFRIGAYWKYLEPKRGVWDFSDLDKDINAISRRKGTIVLAIGQKTPRWPECWQPDWWNILPAADQEAATLTYLQTVVDRYKNNPLIVAWQVENEPHFEYGDCGKTDPEFHKKEIKLVRGLDPNRPVFTTDSGELSLWTSFGKTIDRLGVSVYRVVRNPTFGTWRYFFLPPSFYRHKAELLSVFGVPSIYVSEFQMEPWNNKPLTATDIPDQLKTFDIKQMRANIDYASRMGLSPVDYWGVEWWYWMKTEQGHPEFWEEAKRIW